MWVDCIRKKKVLIEVNFTRYEPVVHVLGNLRSAMVNFQKFEYNTIIINDDVVDGVAVAYARFVRLNIENF